MEKSISKRDLSVLTPLLGTLIFTVLYIIAAFLYPGGSQVDKNAAGFSWTNNYWCNLLSETAINGQHNAARPVALTAMFILCLTLGFFWYLFPRHMHFGRYSRLAIQLSGTIAMMIAMFLFTNFHDIVLHVASVFGFIALSGVFIALYKSSWNGLFRYGILNLILVGLNNYLYYTKGLIIYLPIVQKVSFASFLIWICCIDIRLYRKIKSGLSS